MKCPNAGADKRTLSWLICPLQWLCRWYSEKPPLMHIHLWMAWCYWPPYFVKSVPVAGVRWPDKGFGQCWEVFTWRMFRVGWRYDKNWLNPKTGKKGGYIGPSAAWKIVNEPLLFY